MRPIENIAVSALVEIDESPTVDVESVVRCKDCIHAQVYGDSSVSCGYWTFKCCDVMTRPDGFCSNGKKRK